MNVPVPGQMFNTAARTIRCARELKGVGLHTGAPALVRVHPAVRGHGLQLVSRSGRSHVHVDHATAPGGRTALGDLQTVEHLLAAVLAAGITDLDILVEGPEIPAVDGSAAPWAALLDDPVLIGEIEAWTPSEPVIVEAFGGTACFTPGQELVLDVTVDFPGLQQSRRQTAPFDAILDARTFTLHARLDALAAAGFGRGLRNDAVVVWGPRGSLVPLRHPDEPARHKILDLLGDLALFGRPLGGTVRVVAGSHALHQELVRRCVACDPRLSRSG